MQDCRLQNPPSPSDDLGLGGRLGVQPRKPATPQAYSFGFGTCNPPWSPTLLERGLPLGITP